MNESQAIAAFGALSHETRLQIVRHLVKAGADGDTAGSIGEAVAAAPSKVTFHMATLERAGLVSSERVSRQIYYRIVFERLGGLAAYLLHDCCAGHKDVIRCCGEVELPGRC